MLGIVLQGLAQSKGTIDSLNRVINDSHNRPESRVLACVVQGEYYINKPVKTPKDLDSASVALKKAQYLKTTLNAPSTAGEILFLAALISKRKDLKEEGNRLNDQALTFLKKKPGSDFLGRALLEKGDYLNIDDSVQLKQKIKLLNEAMSCFQNAKFIKTRAGLWKSIGDLYGISRSDPGNLALALEAYQRSMNTYFSYGYRNVQDIYVEMSGIYRDLGNDKEGLHYCLMAIQTAERARDSSMTMCQIYNTAGMQYCQLLDYANAKKYWLKSLKLAEKLNDKGAIFNLTVNLYTAYRHDNEYGKLKQLLDRIHSRFPENDLQNQYVSGTLYLGYYTDIKDLVNGKKYSMQLIKLISTANEGILRHIGQETYSAIADYYTLASDFNNAYKYWKLAYSTMMRFDNRMSNKAGAFHAHFKIDTASHNMRSAISYLVRYAKLRDTMYTVSKAEQEANLRVLYDTKEKEYELAESKQKIHMLTQNEQLQRANLKQAVLMRNITIAFTIIVIIVSALLLRMVILRKKAMRKIARTNSLLEKLVSEKEWLLREIHHRVKNNLHTIICLLESQATYLEKDALKAIDDSRHRIYAMSLIHQKLYENDDVKTIDMNDYVTSLIHYLQDCYDLKNNITFHLEIAPVLIDASIAIPIGLIINEAVTNAIKYAFPKNAAGRISIKLYEDREKIIVIVADNGIGINMELINKPAPSMGLRLIKGLCDDIGGKISFNNDTGTEIKLICNRIPAEEEVINMQELLNNIPDAT
jgi:two-component sensor histidine kinase